MTVQKIPADIRRVLSISAHPDDSEFFAGGTLAQFAEAGAEISLVVCTDGGRGGRDLLNVRETRFMEQDAAAAALGIKSVNRLGFHDGDLVAGPELRDQLIRLIRATQPDIVMGHHPATWFTRYGRGVQLGHSDHRAVGSAMLDAIYPRAGSPNFLTGEDDPWRPREVWLFDCAEPDFLVDVAAGFEQKIDSLAAHASQQGAGDGLLRAARRVGALLGTEDTPAEGFVRLRLG